MTRDQYVNMRQSKRFDFNLFYEYYLENNKKPNVLDFSTFQQLFHFYFQSNVRDIISYLDKKFNLYILEDKNGNEIRVW